MRLTPLSRRLGRLVGAGAFALTLSACGGGSESQINNTVPVGPVPTNATSALGTDEASARSVVSLLVTADEKAIERDEDFKKIGAGLPQPGGSGSSGSGVQTKLIDQTQQCNVIYPVGEPLGESTVSSCSGSVTILSNFDDVITEDSDLLPAGAYLTTRFNGISITLSDGGSVSIGGTISFTVLESSSLSDAGLAGSFRISAEGLTGVDDDGETFGPETFAIDATYDANGNVSYVLDGDRVGGLQITEGTNDDSYTINSGSLITDYQGGHAEVSFDNWRVIDGIPQIGSRIVVNGANGSATATVQSASATQVVFEVVMSADGTQETHLVTASINGTQITVN